MLTTNGVLSNLELGLDANEHYLHFGKTFYEDDSLPFFLESLKTSLRQYHRLRDSTGNYLLFLFLPFYVNAAEIYAVIF
jgi:hypothetical protein